MMIAPIVGTICVPTPTNAWVSARKRVLRMMMPGIGPPRAVLDRTAMYDLSPLHRPVCSGSIVHRAIRASRTALAHPQYTGRRPPEQRGYTTAHVGSLVP